MNNIIDSMVQAGIDRTCLNIHQMSALVRGLCNEVLKRTNLNRSPAIPPCGTSSGGVSSEVPCPIMGNGHMGPPLTTPVDRMTDRHN